jgi:hypothetical protein
VALALSSDIVSVPVDAPMFVGTKSTAYWQDAPWVSVCDPVAGYTSGQVVAGSNMKPVLICGFVPATGTNVSDELPMLPSVATIGLSTLVAPTFVSAKLKMGGEVTVTFTMAPLVLLAT